MNEAQFKTLRELSAEGTVSQRDLSKKVGLSLGSVNYIMKELIKRGYVKAQRFKNSIIKPPIFMFSLRKELMPVLSKHNISFK